MSLPYALDIIARGWGSVREPQRPLTAAIVNAIATGTPLLAEAPTGTGKSAAYLAAAIASASPERRVIIATRTKLLQAQLLADIRSRGLQGVAVFMGRGNYLCTKRAEARLKPADLVKVRGRRAVTQSEFEALGLDVDWSDVCSRRGCCLDKNGVSACECYVEARTAAQAASVVITNFAMTIAHARILRSDADEFDANEAEDERKFYGRAYHLLGQNIGAWIFDEAHELPDALRGACSRVLSESFVKAHELNEYDALAIFRLRIAEVGEHEVGGGAHAKLDAALDALAGTLHVHRQKHQNLTVFQHQNEMRRKIAERAALFRVRDPRFVFVLEQRPESFSLRTYTYETAGTFQRFFGDVPVIGLSATMTVGGSFDAIARDFGLSLYSSCVVPSALSYEQAGAHVLVGVTTEQTVVQCCNENRPLTLVLTKSRNRALEIAKAAESAGFGGRLLLQTEDASVSAIVTEALRRKADGVPTVLIGTDALWTGVDVSPTVVLTDKLPFPRPDTPDIAYLRRRYNSGVAFNTSRVRMLTQLRQGAGRLIRKQGDAGAFVLHVDSATAAKGYMHEVTAALIQTGFQGVHRWPQ